MTVRLSSAISGSRGVVPIGTEGGIFRTCSGPSVARSSRGGDDRRRTGDGRDFEAGVGIARTSNSPGSLMPGVPASETTATSPRRRAHRAPRSGFVARCARWRPPAACHALRQPASSRPVRRVSSQQISSAAANVSIDRGDRSPRLPIGVATRTSREARSPASVWALARVAVAQLDDVADREPPSLERPGGGLDHPAAALDRRAAAPAACARS